MRPNLILFNLVLLISSISNLSAQTRDYAQNVTIARDKWGVPHIYGKTDADVAYGLAWAHAEDDFKTIEETVLMAKGRYGLVKGKKGAISDFFVQAMRLDEVVQQKYNSDLTPEFHKYLDGYAAGLNAYVKAHPKEVRVKKAFPVNGKDLVKGYVLQMLFVSYIHQPAEKILKGGFDIPEVKGSNAFAFSNPKTKNGNTLLCVNPHVPYEGLFSWYEAHLKSDEGMDIMGALFPGGITIFLGTNQNLGWSHTRNEVNLIDTYRLKMNPDKKNQYWLDGKWETLETGKAHLKVKLKKWLPRIPVKKKLYWSKFGPTLKSENGQFYSLRDPAIMEIKGGEQWYRMNKATNKQEYMDAIRMNSIILFNIIYADKEGNITYIDNGMVPKRDNSLNWQQPVPGDTSAYLWTSLYPTDSLPTVQNPSCGWLFNTNNTPYNVTAEQDNIPYKKFCDNMGFCMGNNNRATRFTELMKEHGTVSFEDMKQIKFDNRYSVASPFVRSVQQQIDIDCGKPELNDLRRRMLAWDLNANPESTGATLYLIAISYIFEKKDYDDHNFLAEVVIEKELMVEALQYTYDHLMKYFGTTEVPLGKVQRIRRGSKDVSLPGFPDVLAANYSKPDKDNGLYYGFIGDAYTLMVEYGPNGPAHIETLSPYGSSARPDSKHYTDQLDLFSHQQTKTMTMDWQQILKDAERVYRPGE
jgi:acyl-homoserine-lactone acylase